MTDNATPSAPQEDKVDLILRQWHDERPDIDPSPMAITGRLARVLGNINPKLQQIFGQYNLNPGEFDVLASLRRAGSPYTLTPNQLLDALMLTSGAMTNRIDRLEQKGLVSRSPDPNDRRGVYVSLTDAGMDLIDDAVTDHTNNLHQLLAGLTADEQAELAVLLKKLLAHVEPAS
ncbi:MarR family transcriptional regulator [Salinivibrio sp. SS3]|uniref:MarR family winged helix-turn-helix transcriptional regulator n=1 Tax=Salinivibrio sp. SS3 TaxID=1895021 RepID=UPI000847FE8D|nr:MarR family transcriptional regulator [Salinivibrio sp. BNH]ODP99018.1 MarR family transcriptional regulator [Salinivibrio sp. BNH]